MYIGHHEEGPNMNMKGCEAHIGGLDALALGEKDRQCQS